MKLRFIQNYNVPSPGGGDDSHFATRTRTLEASALPLPGSTVIFEEGEGLEIPFNVKVTTDYGSNLTTYIMESEIPYLNPKYLQIEKDRDVLFSQQDLYPDWQLMFVHCFISQDQYKDPNLKRIELDL